MLLGSGLVVMAVAVATYWSLRHLKQPQSPSPQGETLGDRVQGATREGHVPSVPPHTRGTPDRLDARQVRECLGLFIAKDPAAEASARELIGRDRKAFSDCASDVLGNGDLEMRRAALQVVRLLPVLDERVIRALGACMVESDPLGMAACDLLRDEAKREESCVAFAMGRLGSPGVEGKEYWLFVLGGAAERRRDLWPTFVGHLRDGERNCRRNAVAGIGHSGERGDTVRRALLSVLESDEDLVAVQMARGILEECTSWTSDDMAAIRRALSRRDVEARCQVLSLVIEAGRAAAPVLEAVVQGIASTEHDERSLSIEAAVVIGRADPSLCRALEKAAQEDKDPALRDKAAAALAKLRSGGLDESPGDSHK